MPTRIDPPTLGLPDEETMACEAGLMVNHYYRDLRWMGLEDFDRIWDAEVELLEYVADGGDLSSDEASVDLCDNEVYMLDLDPGVASTVAALAALGAVPVTSCTGEPGHYERHPLVGFWATREHVPDLVAAADEAGVYVTGTDLGLMVFTESDVSLMRDFAQALVRRLRATRE